MVKSDRVTSAVRKLQDNLYANVSFQEAIARPESTNVVWGFFLFLSLVTANLFRLIRFNLVNRQVAEFSKTLKTSARPLSSFLCCVVDFLPCFLHFVF